MNLNSIRRKVIHDDNRFTWTEHAKRKIGYYRLSPNKIKNIIDTPQRREEAIVEGLVAAMRTSGSKKHSYEIWTMYAPILIKRPPLQLANKQIDLAPQRKIKIISVWRYPGVTEPGMPIPVPDDVLIEHGWDSDKIETFNNTQ